MDSEQSAIAYMKSYAAQDWVSFRETLADSVLLTENGVAEQVSGDEVVRRWQDQYAAFPDLATETIRIIPAGAHVIIEFVSVGTNTGALTNPEGSQIPPTGQSFTFTGADVMRVSEDGRITELANYIDFSLLAMAIVAAGTS